MNGPFPFTHWLERGDEEIELVGTYCVGRYYPATWEQPAEGGEVEILTLALPPDGMQINLTDAEEEKILDALNEQAGDDLAREAADRADYEYDRWRDECMERGR
jgi:hypothetical protein